MAIGYGRACNLMRQLDWKMRVSTLGDGVEKIVLFHGAQPIEYTVRLDSGRKLMRECVVSERLDSHTAILSYNRTKAEAEDEPKWFAVTRWAPEDVVGAAEEQGVILSVEQATVWWERNERRFQNLLVERGNEILAEMDFEEVDDDGQG